MAAANGGRLFSVCSAYIRSVGCAPQPGLIQVRGYAARKGTREKARKSKVKVEVKKVGFIPHNQRDKYKQAGALVSKRLSDSNKPVSPDNVWVAKYYKWRIYSFAEAVQCHRESHHPTVYDQPDAPLIAYVELDMQGAKKTKFLDKFTRMAPIPHAFRQDHERSILAFCKGADMQEIARKAGASLVGGPETVKEVMAGALSLNDFTVIVAHPNILPELVALKGLMRKRFPTLKDGNLGPDIEAVVKKYADGIEYHAIRDDRELDFGTIQTPIGRLDMEPKHLEENFAALLQDIQLKKPRRDAPFITRTLLLSPPSVERLKINFEQYISMSTNEKDGADTDEEDEPQAAASSN